MKSLFFVPVFCIISGISFTASAQHGKVKQSKQAGTAPKFIEDIDIKPNTAVMETSFVKGDIQPNTGIQVKYTPSAASNIEALSGVQFKYAQLLNCDVECMKNLSLYNFIEEWWQTRYQYGGTTKKGIDCSAFTASLMTSVFKTNIARTARDQYSETERVDRADLTEGDLVFFNTRGGISHVGVYLGQNYFVHASTNSGVTISSLDEEYYTNRFISGGRLTADKDVAKKLN